MAAGQAEKNLDKQDRFVVCRRRGSRRGLQ